MNYADIFNNEIMPQMPGNAELILNEQADHYSASVFWKLNNDPDRPNKRSKTIAIIISRESIEDIDEMPAEMKNTALNKLADIIKNKLSTFDPSHDTPYNEPGPVEKWVITLGMLLG